VKEGISGTVEAIRALAAEVAAEAGVEVVDLELKRAPKRWCLRLDIDRAGPRGVGLDDCQRVSRDLEAEMDRLDLMDHAYTLEVSSPGIDRPIRTADDIRRNTGRMVDLELREPLEGRRCLSGLLLGLEGGRMRVREGDESEVLVPLELVLRACQHVPF
jgi:ribosome maturation factor RimP